MRFLNLILILLIGQNVLAQYPGCVGSANTSAMHTDSSVFVAWAKSCSITRGLQDISNSVLGYASVGDSSFALSKADGAVVSLGDNGIAVVSFSAPITNGPGFDFAVFENSFNDSFLELAFVEVSSDGINYFRFPAVSNLPVSPQYDNSAIMDASKINHLAGKYRALYGTPFDLYELTGIPQLDITNVTHVKIIDVVGSINHAYARFDSQNQIINDPWPTPFNSSGFDLDAIGVINQKAVGINEINSQSYFKLYPNPANDILFIQTNEINEKTEISLSDLTGKALISEYTLQTTLTIDISTIQSGVYILTISNTKDKQRTKNNKTMRIIALLIVVSILGSCVKDKPNDALEPQVSIGSGHKVYVINEGNFGSNNGSVSLYELSNGNLTGDLYKAQNNNAALGDVCQSMIKINNSFYIVVNNSAKITIVGADDFKLKSAITGFNSPRYILPVSPNKAYVSDLYANAISIIDLNSNTKTGSIPCNGWTEQMALLYNKAFVTNMKSNYLYVVNTINDQITDSVSVGPGAGSIVIDKNSKVWVLSAGSSTATVPGKLTRINPINMQIELSLNFNTTDAPGNLCINAAKDRLYFLNSNVYSMSIADNTLPVNSFANGSSHTFYGLAVNNITNDVYVSDAIDYIQKSSIMVYSPQGQLLNNFKAGINASGFYFE